jgi:hypothetical protein
MRETIEGLWCGNRNLVARVCNISTPEKSERLSDIQIRRIVMRLNAMLVTRVLDSLSENEINDMVDLISEDILNANKVKQKKTRVNRLTRILRKPKQVGK